MMFINTRTFFLEVKYNTGLICEIEKRNVVKSIMKDLDFVFYIFQFQYEKKRQYLNNNTYVHERVPVDPAIYESLQIYLSFRSKFTFTDVSIQRCNK